MLRTVKWFPLSHLRGGSISAQVKEIQVHTRMFPSSTGLASIWLAAVLSGIAVASSILCNPSKGGPTEICSSLSLLRACRGVQPFCTSRQSPRQAEGSMGQQHLDQLNWSVWTRVFMASVLNLIIQQLSSGTNLSTCIVGGERSSYKNTGTSEYKIVLPLPSQHYSHLQLKRNVYLLSSVIYIYLVKICYLTDFHIQPGKKKISYTHLLRENTEARNMISLLTSADIIST